MISEKSKQLFGLLLLVIAYYVTAMIGLGIASVNGFATLIWAPTGISFVALLMFGYRLWPGVFIAAVAANISAGAAIPQALGIGVGNTLEAIVGVYLFSKIAKTPKSLDNVQNVLAFLFGAVLVSTMVSATIGVGSLWTAGRVPPNALGDMWGAWWVGDMMGNLIVGSLLLVWWSRPRKKVKATQVVEAAITVLTALVTAVIVFHSGVDNNIVGVSRTYFVFPILIWSSLRYGQRGGVTMTLLVLAVAIWSTVEGYGPFQSQDLSEGLLRLQIFMGIVATTILFLSTIVDEEIRGKKLLESAREELEQRVHERTAELSKANRNLTEAQSQAHIGSWEWDIKANRVSWSDELYRVFGTTPDDFESTYESYLSFVHTNDRARVKEIIDTSYLTGEPFIFDHQIQCPDGTVKMLHARGTVFKDQYGNAVRMAGTAQDITQRYEAEIQYQNLLESAPDAMVVVDNAGVIVLVNAQTEKVFGYDRKELLGKNVEVLMPGQFHSRHLKHRAEYVANAHTRPMGIGLELFGLKKNGVKFPVEISLSPLATSKGMLVTSTIRDITDKKLVENEIRTLTEELERRVTERTGELGRVNEELKSEIAAREKLEESLRSSTEYFRDLVENITEVYYITDAHGKITYASPQYYQRGGYEEHEVIGRSYIGFMAPEDRRRVIAHYVNFTSSQARDTLCEFRALFKNGTTVWVDQTTRVIRDEKGYPLQYRNLVRDISERKKIEQALHESEEKFRALAETAQSAIVMYESNMIIYANPAAEHISGFSKSELLQKKFWEIIHPEYSELVKERGLARQRGDNVPSRYEIKLLSKTGEPRWIDAVASTFEINGKTIALVVALDITERKKSEENIQMLAHAVESTSEMICITNLENEFIFLNRAFLNAYGYKEWEVIGRKPDMLWSPRHDPEFTAMIYKQTREKAWSGEVYNVKKDGTEFPIFLSTAQIKDYRGNIIGLIGVARDIGERKQAEQALKGAEVRFRTMFDKVRSEFSPFVHPGDGDPLVAMNDLATGIEDITEKMQNTMQQILSFSTLTSHELRTPLTVLRHELESALRMNTSEEELRKVVISTYDEILRLNRVIVNLINLSSMQTGTFKLNARRFDMKELLKEFYNDALLLARERDISVTMDKCPPVFINGDAEQIRHLLFNLFDNAVKHVPEQGRLRLKFEVEGSDFILQFSDNGCGIEQGELVRIFEPFYRGKSSSTRGQGVGLGLALVKSITDIHGGKIEVQSKLKEGTTFILRIPRVE